MANTPASILKDVFGYDSFRPLQREVIENILNRRDTLAIMPTGGGKSLCYQVPALLFSGLTVVVSPLIALMKDQVEQMHASGVAAIFINSTLSAEAYQENMGYVRRGETRLLYLAPETLLTPRILDLLAEVTVDCFAIDEAHCISEWGHDFRPEYRLLVEARKRFPKAVCLALTATATQRVRDDIRKNLGMSTVNEFIGSFNRPNLYIEVTPKRDPAIQTFKFLQRFKDQPGIIYCFSRRQVDELTLYLQNKGFSVRPYHAGLQDDERRRNQEAFIRDDAQIIVATIAFGMGINKPNVRFVIHYDLPKSLENYYQEIGRAGRDGLAAHCLLLYNYSDAIKLKALIKQKEDKEQAIAEKHIDAMVRYAEDQSICRRVPILKYFGEIYKDHPCHNCDNCEAPPPTIEDITVPAQKFLSCVKRTGERFGAAHVIDVLLGSKKEKVLKFEHEKLTTFGIGKDLTQKQWMHLARQLLQMGYLQQEEKFHTLSLTTKASEALRMRTLISGQLQEAEEKALPGANKDELEYNHALFALLRARRKELADQAGVPPYVIFSDRTLIEMSTYFPQSSLSLLEITGVGKAKASQYGDTFLELINTYCEKHKIPDSISQRSKTGKAARSSAQAKQAGITPRLEMIAESFNQGTTLAGMAEKFEVTEATILNNLLKFVEEGGKLQNLAELESQVSAGAMSQLSVHTAFEELGMEFLKPVYERMNGTVNYEDLKILRVIHACRQKD